jgi:hypothetical protein
VDSIQRLLRQVRRKQLLVCAYQGDEGTYIEPTLAELPELLTAGTAECLALVQRLHAKDLIAGVPQAENEPVKLTPKGERLVRRMSRANPTQPQA